MLSPNRSTHSTPLGPTLTQLRRAHGWSQPELAEQLCIAAGLPTVTRNEISRWERQQRIPGSFWLGLLAAVLETSLDHLKAAAAITRRTVEPISQVRQGNKTHPPPLPRWTPRSSRRCFRRTCWRSRASTSPGDRSTDSTA
ncbi:helix-turn-helix domain-containing protein [Micromonospora polyrhachis]|uniref:helix-turn-helix domain-containing protein n=1 Tax=Micromonospora polyrhachis TaxID=1282883 RepID=UPI00160CE837